MITVRMEIESQYGPSTFTKSFDTPTNALAYLGGYIGVRPITITSMEVDL